MPPLGSVLAKSKSDAVFGNGTYASSLPGGIGSAAADLAVGGAAVRAVGGSNPVQDAQELLSRLGFDVGEMNPG
jgi:hypothetical protein